MNNDNNENRVDTSEVQAEYSADIISDVDAVPDTKVRRKLNIIPKIICLLFAVLIWYYVMQVDNPDYQQTFNGIKVNLVNSDELTNRGLSIFTGTNYSADLTVSGKKSVISKYTSEDIVVQADILKSYTSPGMQVVDLDVTLPSGLSLVNQDNTISVFVDEKTSVKIPITVDQRTGATTSGDYEPGTLAPEFSEITVKGPKTIVDNVDHATVKADFSEFGVLESTTTTDGTVVLFNKDGDELSSAYLSIDYTTMKVTFPIYLTRELPLTVSYKNGLYNDSNVSVSITPETAQVKGDASYIKKLDNIEVAVIDEKQIEKDKTLTFELVPTDDYTFADDIATVDVKITNVGTITRIYRVTNFSVNKGGKDFKITNEYVDVTLRGPAAKLEAISADDITVRCDLSDFNELSNGEYDATIAISGNPSDVWEIGTYKLTVSVTQ